MDVTRHGTEAAQGRGTTAGTPLDGRRLRREHGRLAVIQATIALVMDGHAPTSVEQIARRAGVSVASLFRYFPTVDELRREAIDHCSNVYADLRRVPELGLGSRARRVERLVDARLRFYEATGPIARLARREAPQVAAVRESLGQLRNGFATQLDRHFGPELDRLSAVERRERVALLAAITSFESWDLMREQGLARDEIRRSLTLALDRLLRTSRQSSSQHTRGSA